MIKFNIGDIVNAPGLENYTYVFSGPSKHHDISLKLINRKQYNWLFSNYPNDLILLISYD